MKRLTFGMILLGVAAARVLVVGQAAALAASPATGGENFVMVMEPPGAIDVIAAREGAQDQEDVVVVGRIGGKKVPWIRGMAAFLIVDCSLKPCSELKDDHCPHPWDYCCAPNLAKSMVLVKLVDDSGKIVRQDARQLLQLKELDTVVVQGKARRDRAGNLSIVASRIHVRDDQKAIR
jgi:hypothetical protein